MNDFLKAARALLLDLASTIIFLILFLLTHNAILSVAAGVAFGTIQIAIQLIRRKPVEIMEWLSLFLVIAAGTATILTDDPRFVLFKPSVIYAIIGVVMLKPGWLLRYLPAIAREAAPDVIIVVGYAWAALMLITAAVNALVAIEYSVETWAIVMLIFGIATKVVAFIAGFLAIRLTARRRLRAMAAEKREALLTSAGVHPQASLRAKSA